MYVHSQITPARRPRKAAPGGTFRASVPTTTDDELLHWSEGEGGTIAQAVGAARAKSLEDGYDPNLRDLEYVQEISYLAPDGKVWKWLSGRSYPDDPSLNMRGVWHLQTETPKDTCDCVHRDDVECPVHPLADCAPYGECRVHGDRKEV